MQLGKLMIAALVAAPLGAMAEVDVPAVQACVAGALEAGENPGLCVEEAHAQCHAAAPDAPNVATLCYTNAEAVWGEGLQSVMARIEADATEQIAAIAGIELRYDLLLGRLQCDRVEELSRVVGVEPGPVVQRQKARCTATAAGLAYVRLLWRSEGAE